MTLIKLNLVRHNTSAVALIRGILQVPTGLRFLDETTHHCVLANFSLPRLCLCLNVPHLQVFNCVAILVFRRPLPCDRVCAQWRKAQFEDIIGGEGGNDVANGRINDRDANDMLGVHVETRRGLKCKHTVRGMPMRNSVRMVNRRYNEGFLPVW